ncbi:EboA domain-containing protein [Sphaerisporangium sp. TRM90804]|uniref:EboA domain-containing protein n=1 Tax=Sphaerisporangium sp. TRM90804 TaxID=3031113 RepID=UPI00244B194D|nr:EboA domain-containing protein [Sphaerisporangium sp. TRM90804]MDH2426318.1 EboA domain-containing protein [Sphaerisporangium sp. TRM90804]
MSAPTLPAPGLTGEAAEWLRAAADRIRADGTALPALFPAAARTCGRGPLPGAPGWTVDQAVRGELLRALPLSGEALGEVLFDVYTHGDAAERLAVLKALPVLDAEKSLGEAGLPVVRDALRTNDTRLIEAALGPYAAARLPDHAYRQAVLKCVFVGVPLSAVAGLERRRDAELARMMAGYAEERLLAGREVPPDVWPLAELHPAAPERLRALLAESGRPHGGRPDGPA